MNEEKVGKLQSQPVCVVRKIPKLKEESAVDIEEEKALKIISELAGHAGDSLFGFLDITIICHEHVVKNDNNSNLTRSKKSTLIKIEEAIKDAGGTLLELEQEEELKPSLFRRFFNFFTQARVVTFLQLAHTSYLIKPEIFSQNGAIAYIFYLIRTEIFWRNEASVADLEQGKKELASAGYVAWEYLNAKVNRVLTSIENVDVEQYSLPQQLRIFL
ncbi:hypothetical protein [Wolbachia endosymbiont of Ctenocephalides felis wCfeT]|uniref:hypothetical protein n=1 Tax=Wolbachia endosymbiont of Ctenocephalides felis wCfeT TaxID=2732593 RepID=UPI0014450475|nr:hypothetical protein [Wolbachia endosymbiont of Ctenocephalides felis wCfeT]